MENIYQGANGSLAYFNARFDGDGFVRVFPEGGGFEIKIEEAKFYELYNVADPDFSIHKGVVTADFLETNFNVPCYGTGKLWNGWGTPLFTKEQVNLVIAYFRKHLNESDPVSLAWIDEELIDLSYKDEPEVCSNQIHIEDGCDIKLWSIGNGWCWDQVVFDSPRIVIAESKFPIAKGTVSAVFLEKGFRAPCYGNGRLIEGYGTPLFSKEQIDVVIAHLTKHHDEEPCVLEWKDDELHTLHNNGSEICRFRIHIENGVEIKLWYIGDGWFWDPVIFDSATQKAKANFID